MVTLEDLFPFDPELGYLGILIISFVASLVPFIPIPYFPLLITASFNTNFNPHLIALASASGTVAAKTIIFFASYYGRKILSDNTKQRMRPLQKLVSRYGWTGAFIAALTPIPDDIVYIPLGLAKYSPWKFATATFAGKILMNEAIVWSSIFLGRPFVESIIGDTTDPTWLIVGAIASIAVLGVTIYYSLRIDWAKIIGRWFPWALEDDDNKKEY
ncbi:MAG TPA: VTT domain-containing protein [Nitrososphaera sp.]|nr:VTT domain-containing protein [Nitrososphaera sp.]